MAVVNCSRIKHWPVISDEEFKSLISTVDWWRDGWYNCDLYRRKHDGADLGCFDYDTNSWRVNPEVFKAIKEA